MTVPTRQLSLRVNTQPICSKRIKGIFWDEDFFQIKRERPSEETEMAIGFPIFFFLEGDMSFALSRPFGDKN